MADNRLTGITLQLTDEQRRLLKQISAEDFSEIVVGIGTPEPEVPNEYGKSESDRKFLAVLYETNVDLVQRVEQNPTVKDNLQELAEVGGYVFGPYLPRVSPEQIFSPVSSQPYATPWVSFTGLLAVGAAW